MPHACHPTALPRPPDGLLSSLLVAFHRTFRPHTASPISITVLVIIFGPGPSRDGTETKSDNGKEAVVDGSDGVDGGGASARPDCRRCLPIAIVAVAVKPNAAVRVEE